MSDLNEKLRELTEAAASAVGREVASLRREAQRERDLREAEHQAAMAKLAAAIASVTETERRLAERIAALRDGKDGRDGNDGRDGVDGANGKDGAPGQDGRNGVDGKDAIAPTAEEVAVVLRSDVELAAAEAAKSILDGWERPKDGADGKDGKDGSDGRSVTLDDVAPVVRDAIDSFVAALPAPKDGKDGRDGADGKDGEPGRDGAPGKLPVVRDWIDGVHYEGDVVTHAGGLWQASRDTGREPPHADWMCLARAGRDGSDGRSLRVRGTWAGAETYDELDVVALNGASFIARHDNPGPCPGEGWQMVAGQGKQGKPGLPGPPGKAGPVTTASVVAAQISDQGMLTLVNADGTTVDCDLYPVLSRLG